MKTDPRIIQILEILVDKLRHNADVQPYNKANKLLWALTKDNSNYHTASEKITIVSNFGPEIIRLAAQKGIEYLNNFYKENNCKELTSEEIEELQHLIKTTKIGQSEL